MPEYDQEGVETKFGTISATNFDAFCIMNSSNDRNNLTKILISLSKELLVKKYTAEKETIKTWATMMNSFLDTPRAMPVAAANVAPRTTIVNSSSFMLVPQKGIELPNKLEDRDALLDFLNFIATYRQHYTGSSFGFLYGNIAVTFTFPSEGSDHLSWEYRQNGQLAAPPEEQRERNFVIVIAIAEFIKAKQSEIYENRKDVISRWIDHMSSKIS